MAGDEEYLKALEIQRRNFEAQFGSLETLGYEDKVKEKSTANESDAYILSNSDSDSDFETDGNAKEARVKFGGFSSEEEESEEEEEEEYDDDDDDDDDDHEEEVVQRAPVVVKLNTIGAESKPEISKKQLKIVRSGKIPTLSEVSRKEALLKKLQINKNPTNKEDQENLKNDLELQRLLKESHILAQSIEHSGADLTLNTLDHDAPIGKARKRTLDSRIRNLAETNSKSGGLPKKLEKMPMGMRKGMIESRVKKIAKYEEDAKNAGIVLSKVKKGELRNLDAGRGSTPASDRIGTGVKKRTRLRDRGLKINTIGRNTRHGLIISKEEINKFTSKPRRRK